ncbi:MAG: Lhr family ATP-dependent helicase, partial [Aureliella sp.]
MARAGKSGLKPTFFDVWSPYILVFTLALVPGIFYCAGKAVQSNVNKVEDWLPKTFEETKQLAWFRKHFASDQFIVISWEGCRIGELDGPDAAATDDPRIERLANLLVAGQAQNPDAPELAPVKPVDEQWKADAARYFKSVTTGRRVLERLTTAPLGLEPDDISAALVALEVEGFALRGHFTPGSNAEEWCDRRLLARIHHYTVRRLRAEIEPVAARDFLRFLLDWQRVTPETRLEGPDAVSAAVALLEGFEVPAGAWETEILPGRIIGYETAWLD